MARLMIGKGGRRQMFATLQEGEDAGFYPTFNDMAKACNRAVAAPEPPPAAPEPAPEASVSMDKIREYAQLFGFDPAMHHATMRKKVEEQLNAESGSDQPGLQ
jgi:hypothetical protein